MRAFVRVATASALIVAGCRDRSAETPPPVPATPSAVSPSPAPPHSPPNWKEAFSHDVRYDGENRAVVVDVRIAPGFHAYTTGETTGKPLKIALTPGGGYGFDGPIQYPKGIEKNLPIGRSVIVEGNTQIVAKVSPQSPNATGPVKGVFHYQVCTDEACDRPRKAPFAVAVP